MSEFILETKNLSKRYRRRAPLALDAMNLQVPRGALYGFVGPNGAGKTTALRLMAGLLEPTAGEVFIAGHSLRREPQTIRRLVGYMPDFFGVYHEMTAAEYLDFFARCHDLPAQRRRTIVAELLELVNLADKGDEEVGNLSRGMQQRLCLARALVHDPQVLLLDEPASGLDPRARVEMRELLRELSAMGKTIVLSSHILSELADMCTEVGIIDHGRIIASGPLAELRTRVLVGALLRIHVLSDAESAVSLLEAYPGVSNVLRLNGADNSHDAWLEVYLSGDTAAHSQLLTHLVQQGVAVAEFRRVSDALEELFLQLTDS